MDEKQPKAINRFQILNIVLLMVYVVAVTYFLFYSYKHHFLSLSIFAWTIPLLSLSVLGLATWAVVKNEGLGY